MGSSSDVHDCTTCGWGVQWEEVGVNDKISGKCQWQCPVPHPAIFNNMFSRFSPASRPQDNCPAWKQAERPELMQKWGEHPNAYSSRLLAMIEDTEAMQQKLQEMNDQCFRCAHIPDWNACSNRRGLKYAVCKAGRNLCRFQDDIMVDDHFLTTICPAYLQG